MKLRSLLHREECTDAAVKVYKISFIWGFAYYLTGFIWGFAYEIDGFQRGFAIYFNCE